MSVPHDHCDARPPTVIFLALEQHTPFTSAKLYWYHLVTEARVHKLSYSIHRFYNPQHFNQIDTDSVEDNTDNSDLCLSVNRSPR